MSPALITAHTDKLLKPLGFRRRGKVWNRKISSFVDVIDVQIAKMGEIFTVNAGVYHPGIYKYCWGEETGSHVHEQKCIVRTRIGELIDNRDLWCSLEDEVSIEDVVRKIAAHVVPLLDSMHSFVAMENFLAARMSRKGYPPPVIYCSILKYERGEREEAYAMLAELSAGTSGPWKEHIAEVLQRLRSNTVLWPSI